jgi:uncharacterized protein (DUF2252 family)
MTVREQAVPEGPPELSHLTAGERAAQGKAARAAAPRSGQSRLEVAAGRDPIELLEAQARSRLPELVPIRYGRMLVSPLAFFRGGATVMAHDLAGAPRAGLRVQLSGDAHLLNFGAFASPERDLVFDLNDFDETSSGPFEWDVKRLAASFEIAGRQRNFRDGERMTIALGTVRAYRRAMRQFGAMGDLQVWYARLDARAMLEELRRQHDRKLARALNRSVAKARAKDGVRALAKLTHEVDGEPRFVSEPPLIVPLAELIDDREAADAVEAQLLAIFRRYRRTLPHDRRTLLDGFRYVDLARRVVGIGAVGTRCWLLLLLGRDERDPLFLQIKEAEASVLEPLLGRSRFANHGQRVVEGQRLLQASSDIFLGWIQAESEVGSRDYYVRQLWDWKGSVDVETILPRGLAQYGAACGWTLARAHARSGNRIAIGSYLGRSDRFDRAVAEFAAAYADLNEDDYRALERSAAEGRVSAVTLD